MPKLIHLLVALKELHCEMRTVIDVVVIVVSDGLVVFELHWF